MKNNQYRISLYSIILIFIVGFVNCRSLNPFSDTYNNYYKPDFQCFAEPGWRDTDKFLRYKEIWQLMREKYKEENKSLRRANTVIIGNSLVHLFTPDLIEKEFPDKKVVNRGIGGDMTETLLERIQEDALVLKPSTIIIEIGGNDLIQGKCLSLIENNYRKLISTIRKDLPRSKIIFISIPPTDVGKLNAVVPVMNSYLASLVEKSTNVKFVDTWGYMRDDDLPRIRREFLREGGRDKIHFNEKGYSVWGKLLRPLL